MIALIDYGSGNVRSVFSTLVAPVVFVLVTSHDTSIFRLMEVANTTIESGNRCIRACLTFTDSTRH